MTTSPQFGFSPAGMGPSWPAPAAQYPGYPQQRPVQNRMPQYPPQPAYPQYPAPGPSRQAKPVGYSPTDMGLPPFPGMSEIPDPSQSGGSPSPDGGGMSDAELDALIQQILGDAAGPGVPGGPMGGPPMGLPGMGLDVPDPGSGRYQAVVNPNNPDQFMVGLPQKRGGYLGKLLGLAVLVGLGVASYKTAYPKFVKTSIDHVVKTATKLKFW